METPDKGKGQSLQSVTVLTFHFLCHFFWGFSPPVYSYTMAAVVLILRCNLISVGERFLERKRMLLPYTHKLETATPLAKLVP
jgi:hypothetical protein